MSALALGMELLHSSVMATSFLIEVVSGAQSAMFPSCSSRDQPRFRWKSFILCLGIALVVTALILFLEFYLLANEEQWAQCQYLVQQWPVSQYLAAAKAKIFATWRKCTGKSSPDRGYRSPTPDQLRRLARTRSSGLTCSICLDDLYARTNTNTPTRITENDNIWANACGHVFHFTCIAKWVGYHPRNPSCPMCRSPVLWSE